MSQDEGEEEKSLATLMLGAMSPIVLTDEAAIYWPQTREERMRVIVELSEHDDYLAGRRAAHAFAAICILEQSAAEFGEDIETYARRLVPQWISAESLANGMPIVKIARINQMAMEAAERLPSPAEKDVPAKVAAVARAFELLNTNAEWRITDLAASIAAEQGKDPKYIERLIRPTFNEWKLARRQPTKSRTTLAKYKNDPKRRR
jgi:hypothetical protein